MKKFYWIKLAADWAARPSHSIQHLTIKIRSLRSNMSTFFNVKNIYKYEEILLDQLGSGLSCSPVPLNPTSDHKDPLASVKFVNFFSFLLLLDQADIGLLFDSTLEYKDPLALVKHSSNFFDDYPLEALSIWGSSNPYDSDGFALFSSQDSSGPHCPQMVNLLHNHALTSFEFWSFEDHQKLMILMHCKVY